MGDKIKEPGKIVVILSWIVSIVLLGLGFHYLFAVGAKASLLPLLLGAGLIPPLHRRPWYRKLVSIGFLLGLGAVVFSGGIETAPNRNTASSIPAGPIKENCKNLVEKFGVASRYSDLQKKQNWEYYRGREFSWKLKVSEVSNQVVGDGYVVQFRCVPSDSYVVDVLMTFPSRAGAKLSAMNKGDIYQVKGILRDYNAAFGLIAEASGQ